MAQVFHQNSITSMPTFPDFRPIEISDRDAMQSLLAREQPVISELTFPNIYLWRRSYDFGISRIGEGMAILAHDNTGKPFFLPPIGVDDKTAVGLEMLSAMPEARICRVPEVEVHSMDESVLKSEFDRDNSDYVYLMSDLVQLPGRKYHKKRNHIAQFKAKYGDYEYRRVTPDMVEQCVALQRAWCDIRGCFIPGNRSLAEEHESVMEALSLLEPLGLLAGAVMIDDEVAAFSIGSELNKETFVIHFEKANLAYPGLYQVINREYAADVSSDYKFMNREQDLGDEGLRHAKESYYPDHMINKYIVSAK